MEKTFACGDVVSGCKAVFTGKDDNEILQKASAHAKDAHNMQTIPPELVTKVKGLIKDKN